MQNNKPQFVFNDENYIRLLETSNSKMYRKIKRLRHFSLLSFSLLLLMLIAYFLLFKPTSSSDIFDKHLTETGFLSEARLIQSGDKYYQIPDETNKNWITDEGIMVQIKPGSIAFSLSKPLDKQKYYTLYNTGKLLNLKLPDGSTILLNKNTKLEFSLLRNGKTTNVNIEGEAFFKIAKNKDIPFYIQTSLMKVDVFGTEFNIRTSNKQTTITLINGSVQVNNQSGKTFLKPGQQAFATDKQRQIAVKQVNIAKIINWTDSRFSFTNQSLNSILQQIEKWYDVQFIIKNKSLDSIKFTGKFNKQEGLLKFLQILQYTEGIKYQINDKYITLTH